MEEVAPEKKKRRRWSNQEKLRIVRSIKRRIAAGKSQGKACEEMNIDPKQYRTWVHATTAMAKSNPKAMSLCDGKPSILQPISDDLLKFVFELREQGMAVRHNTIRIKAMSMLRDFREKGRKAQQKIIQRWVKKSPFVMRNGTHECQRDPRETHGEATDWIEYIRPFVMQPNRHEDFILNMDQTPVYFTLNENRTLDVFGTRSVPIRKSTKDTRRATFAPTITASGKTLKPFMIFKGTPNARIEKNELPFFDPCMFYCCQKAAWMDESVMLQWVDKVIKPYAQQAPDWVVPLILLDSYRAHMMGSVVGRIEELGCEVKHIPAGCTSLLQPLDVGYNKPFKTRVRDHWEAWMLADFLTSNSVGAPKRSQIAEWCKLAMENMEEQIIMNAWRHHSYAFFIPTVPTRPEGYIDPIPENDERGHDRGA